MSNFFEFPIRKALIPTFPYPIELYSNKKKSKDEMTRITINYW